MNIVIVGGGTAGTAIARQLRFFDKKCAITIIEKSQHNQYSPCSLPYFIEGKTTKEKLFVYESYKEDNIKYYTNTTVQNIDTNSKKITIESSNETQSHKYDKLILATGSVPLLPKIEGLKKFYFLKTIDDADSIKKLTGNFLIVGGGYIGCEVGAGLVSNTKNSVTIAELNDHILPYLDADMAKMIQEYLQSIGIIIHTNTKITSLKNNMWNDTQFDHIIICTGSQPNHTLIQSITHKKPTSLQIEKDIYIAGDCAPSTDIQTQKITYNYFANTAHLHAKIIVDAIVNESKKAIAAVIPNSVSLIGEYCVGSVGTKTEKSLISAKYTGFDYYENFGGKPITIKLFCDESETIVHAQIIGKNQGHVAGKLNIISLCIQKNMKIKELIKLQTCYNPCVASLIDPLVEVAKISHKKISFKRK